MKDEDKINLIKRLDKFMESKIPIHIVLKKREPKSEIPTGPRFLNGLLTGKKAEDIFVIEERKLGKTYVFVDDIYDVNVFTKGNRALAEEVKENLGFKGLGEGVSLEEIDLIKDIKEEN
jgi:hypothetical protein